MNKTVIALTGNATCGKDSTFNVLKRCLKVQRVAFADELKKAVDPVCLDLLKISSFTNDPAQKQIIRNILVCVGNTARSLNENIWVDKVRPLINTIITNETIPVITDCRFMNECDFLQKEMGGVLVFVDRILPDGTLLQPANASEAENYPKLKARADICITASNLQELEEQVMGKVVNVLNLPQDVRVTA
jgi:hypothetical protein